MKPIQERLREPILGNAYEPKQLLAERQEAANVIDGLVEALGPLLDMALPGSEEEAALLQKAADLYSDYGPEDTP